MGVLYKTRNTDLEMFEESLTMILDQIDNGKRPSYIMGDYYINL